MAKAVNEAFLEFQEYIMPLFAHKFPPKGTSFILLNAFDAAKEKCTKAGISAEKAAREMLQQYDYTPEREEFLITNAKFYIKFILRNTEQSHTVSPAFLEKLTNKIAEVFSYYIMHKHTVPTTEKAKNKLRLSVQQEIMQTLFYNNSYIADLKKKHTKKRELRRKPKSVQDKFKKAQRRVKAKAAQNSAKEINEMFIDAQNTPRKGR